MLKIRKFSFKRDFLAEEVRRLFFNFLDSFSISKKKNFLEQLKVMFSTGSNTFYVDFEDLVQFSDELADIIEEQFTRVDSFICDSIFEFARKNFYRFRFINDRLNTRFSIGFYNFPNLRPLESLKCSNIGKLISISGIVIKITEPRLELIQGTFQCFNDSCKFRIKKVDQKYIYSEPKFCPSCGNSNSWNLKLEKSQFIEIQQILIQEIPSPHLSQYTPRTLEVFIKEDSIGEVRLGSKYIFTGLLVVYPLEKSFSPSEDGFFPIIQHLSPEYKSDKPPPFRPFFSTKFITSHVYCLDSLSEKNFLGLTKKKTRKSFFSKKERELIYQIRGQKNLFDFFKFNFLPQIFHENIRAAILLMILGGSKKNQSSDFSNPNINIGLVGDSFPEKILFLKSLSRFSSPVININGQISHDSDITSFISKETGTNFFSIEAGALILANHGICCIEEFDKLKKDDQFSVLKFIEDQYIKVFHGRLDLHFKANVSILASFDLNTKTNQRRSELDSKKKSRLSFLNKFDLVFFLDSGENGNENARFSKTLFQFYQKNFLPRFRIHSHPIFQLYMSFARLLNPVITEENSFLIIRIYKFLRKFYLVNNKGQSFVHVKHLESLIKLSEAFSKLFLCLKVSRIHIKAGTRLLVSSVSSSNFFSRKFFAKINRNYFDTKGWYGYSKKKMKNEFKISSSRFRMIEKNILELIQKRESEGGPGIFSGFLMKSLFLKEPIYGISHQKKKKIRLILFCIKHLLLKKKILIVPTKIEKKKNTKILICLA